MEKLERGTAMPLSGFIVINLFQMKYLVCLISLLFLSSLTGIAKMQSNGLNISLRTGDLLFCSSTSGELSKAIDGATQTANKTHYDHVGIVEVSNDTIWVFHAAPKKGVSREGIIQFITAGQEPISATVYRIKNDWLKAVPAAIVKARSLLGEAYNYTYRISDQGYYCSEYIFEIFKMDSLFSLNPMTFKNPNTGELLPGWVDYYRKLGIEVPEGEPGCNPNGLAACGKLKLIGELRIMDK